MPKITETLSRALRGTVGAPVIIKTKPNSLPMLNNILNKLDFKGREIPLFSMLNVFLPKGVIDKVANLPFVESVFLDTEVGIPEIKNGFGFASFIGQSDGILGLGLIDSQRIISERLEKKEDFVGTQEVRKFVGANEAEEEGFTGQGIKVAVIDSDASVRFSAHKQIMGRIQRDNVRPIFAGDTNGHGSHVTTTIMGLRITSPSGIEVHGISPNVETLVIKSLFTPMGTGANSDVIKGIEIALDWGADIINMSLGSECENPEDDALCDIIKQIPKGKVIFCLANGNSGPGESTVGSPACCENNVVAVGAWDSRNDAIADFSSKGPTVDGRVRPHFVEPGVNIYSGIEAGTLLDNISDKTSIGFSSLSGTSMATPVASGMIALISEMFKRNGEKLTAEKVKDIGKKFGEEQNNINGFGLLNWNMARKYVEEFL